MGNNYVASPFRTDSLPMQTLKALLENPTIIYCFNLNILVGLWPEKQMKVCMNGFSASYTLRMDRQCLQHCTKAPSCSAHCLERSEWRFMCVNVVSGWIMFNIEILLTPMTRVALSQNIHLKYPNITDNLNIT